MRKRPALKPGDVCRFSKKHKSRGNRYLSSKWHKSFVVMEVGGDGSDGRTRVRVMDVVKGYRNKTYVHNFSVRRRELWYTGYNINDPKQKESPKHPVKQMSGLEKLAVKTSFNATRGPHKCHCDDKTFRDFGCVCNGL